MCLKKQPWTLTTPHIGPPILLAPPLQTKSHYNCYTDHELTTPLSSYTLPSALFPQVSQALLANWDKIISLSV